MLTASSGFNSGWHGNMLWLRPRSAAFSRAPKWTPEHRDKKRDPFEVIARFGDLQPNEEIYAEEVTDLSQWLREQTYSPRPRNRDIAEPTLKFG